MSKEPKKLFEDLLPSYDGYGIPAKEPKRLFDSNDTPLYDSAGSVIGSLDGYGTHTLRGHFYQHQQDHYHAIVKSILLPERSASSLEQRLKTIDAEKASQPQKPPKSEPLFSEASSPATLLAMKYIEDNCPDMLEHKDRLEKQIRQLLPVSVDSIIVWGAGATEDVAASADNLTALSMEISGLNASELIEETLQYVNPSSIFGKLFKKEVDIAQNKKLLSSLKNTSAKLLQQCNDFEAETKKNEVRLRIGHTVLLAIRDTSINTQDSILAAMQNRSMFLQSSMQQLRFNGLKLEQIRLLLVEQIHKIDQVLTVVLRESSKPVKPTRDKDSAKHRASKK